MHGAWDPAESGPWAEQQMKWDHLLGRTSMNGYERRKWVQTCSTLFDSPTNCQLQREHWHWWIAFVGASVRRPQSWSPLDTTGPQGVVQMMKCLEKLLGFRCSLVAKVQMSWRLEDPKTSSFPDKPALVWEIRVIWGSFKRSIPFIPKNQRVEEMQGARDAREPATNLGIPRWYWW